MKSKNKNKYKKAININKNLLPQADKNAVGYADTIMDSFIDGKRVPYTYGDGRGDAFEVNIPTDLAELNSLLRFYRRKHPIVSNCIDLYSSMSLSSFILYTGIDKYDIKFNTLSKNLGLEGLIKSLIDDCVTLGEAFAVGNWDIINKTWSSWNVYPPECFEIKRDGKKIVQYIFTDPEKGEESVISPMRVIYCAINKQGYMSRGNSQILPALQDLFYEDQLRTLQRSIIQSHAFPLQLFKLGSAELQWIPPKEHFAELNKLLARAARDPDRKILYHFGLNVEQISTKDGVLDLKSHFDFTTERIALAFGVNKELLQGNSSYAGQLANLTLLQTRLADIKNPLLDLVTQKIFTPYAEINNFIDENYKIVVPSFQFSQNSLLAQNNYELVVRLITEGKLPSSYLEVLLGLDPLYTERAFADSRKSDMDSFSKELILDEVKKNKELQIMYLEGASFTQLVKKIKDNYCKELKAKAKEDISTQTANNSTEEIKDNIEEVLPIDITPEEIPPAKIDALDEISVNEEDFLFKPPESSKSINPQPSLNKFNAGAENSNENNNEDMDNLK